MECHSPLSPPLLIPIYILEHTLGHAEFTSPLLLNTEVSQSFAAINNTVVNTLAPTALHTWQIISLG